MDSKRMKSCSASLLSDNSVLKSQFIRKRLTDVEDKLGLPERIVGGAGEIN